MPSTGQSTDLHPIKNILGVQGLSQAQTIMCFFHQRIVIILHLFDIQGCHIRCLYASNLHGEVFSNAGDDLILLKLIVYDGDLVLLVVFELLSSKGVFPCDGYRLGVGFAHVSGQESSHKHHCGVPYFGVSLLLQSTVF